VCFLALSLPAAAQSPAEGGSNEWAFTTGGAAHIAGGADGGDFWATQLRWGRVLSAPHGPGPLRGSFEYVFELVPAMVLKQACPKGTTSTGTILNTNGTTTTTTLTIGPCELSGTTLSATLHTGWLYGGGFNPFFWQYNFVHDSQQRFVPYIQAGAGML